MNIIEKLKFTAEKPAIFPILKTEKINIIAVGLLENQLLKKHKTAIPTLLTVIKGAIAFEIEDKTFNLNAFDFYQIPVEILHTAKGLETENVFTLTQEK